MDKIAQINRYQWMKLVAFLGSLAFVILLVLFVENLLLAALLAFVISYLLEPVVDSLERAGIARVYSIALCFTVMSILFVLVVSMMTPFVVTQVESFQADSGKYIAGTIQLIGKVETVVNNFFSGYYEPNLKARVKEFIETSTSPDASIFTLVAVVVSQSLTVLFLAPFFAFFLIKDGRSISRVWLSVVPNNVFELILNLHHQINDQMGQFVRARLLEALIIGVLTWVGLWIIGFPYSFLLGIFAALTNLIPYIGPFIGAVPALLIAMVNGESLIGVALVAMVFTIAQLIDVLIIIPLVVAKIVDLHPVTVVISLLIGAQTLGILGMLIAIPVASVLKVSFLAVFTHLVQLRT